jgi:ribose 1,5-bisphosphokinase PhnN
MNACHLLGSWTCGIWARLSQSAASFSHAALSFGLVALAAISRRAASKYKHGYEQMLKVILDAEKLITCANELSTRGMRNAIRRAVDKSATAARKVAVEIIAADIGVRKARIKDAVSKVRRTTQTNLSASFTASKMRISMLATA